MSFFKDFKEDFAQAMNELMPDSNEMYDEEEPEAEEEDVVKEPEKRAKQKENTVAAKQKTSKTEVKRMVKKTAKTMTKSKEKQDDVDIAPEDLTDSIDDLLDQELYGKNSSQQILPDDDMEVNTLDMSVEEMLSQLAAKNSSKDEEQLSVDDMLAQLDATANTNKITEPEEDMTADEADMGMEELLNSIGSKGSDSAKLAKSRLLEQSRLNRAAQEEKPKKKSVKKETEERVETESEIEKTGDTAEDIEALFAELEPTLTENKEEPEKDLEPELEPVPEKKSVKKPEKKAEPVKAPETNENAKITEKAQEPKLKVVEEPETQAEQEEIQKVKEEALGETKMKPEVKKEVSKKPEKASEVGMESVKEPETEVAGQDRNPTNIPEQENATSAIEQLKKMNAQKENKMSQEKDIISINSVEEDKDIKEETNEEVREEIREEIREEEPFNADEADTETTYITKGTKINGDLETDGSIDIIGTVDGNISCKGKVVVGGHVIGDISAGEVYANNAKVEGSIKSYGSVKVGVGSMVIGSVGGESAVIAGAVNGDIDVKGPVIVDSTAVIMGNIKSRSVQINNGAVIEGFCSQSYSDIDVKSFFA